MKVFWSLKWSSFLFWKSSDTVTVGYTSILLPILTSVTGWPVSLSPILCCYQFGEFPWPASAVASCSSGPQAQGTGHPGSCMCFVYLMWNCQDKTHFIPNEFVEARISRHNYCLLWYSRFLLYCLKSKSSSNGGFLVLDFLGVLNTSFCNENEARSIDRYHVWP